VLYNDEDSSKPAVWLGHTGEVGQAADWYAEAVKQFVEQSAGRQHLAWRPLADERPLVGVPLVGAGAGGSKHDKGTLMREIAWRFGMTLQLRRDSVDMVETSLNARIRVWV